MRGNRIERAVLIAIVSLLAGCGPLRDRSSHFG